MNSNQRNYERFVTIAGWNAAQHGRRIPKDAFLRMDLLTELKKPAAIPEKQIPLPAGKYAGIPYSAARTAYSSADIGDVVNTVGPPVLPGDG
ncbi:hypothetical protein [Christensenella tenuis]|uniref:Uncharacterized protein n=1 Tax=Christensenella tenuis TaxID=2763033 RepID=A0ABR7EGL1_9FIRM|nr:hypothetical protein [Christensenella tenuis]MBC5648884.1 hypothetical protein [Christensenella tenuis]